EEGGGGVCREGEHAVKHGGDERMPCSTSRRRLARESASPCITTRLPRSFTVPGARRAPRAAAARALHVPFARSARREPPQRTVRATSTHPLLAIPRGTLPIELAVRADRPPRQARCSQQRDQSSSQHETTQHCTSRIAIYSPSGG